MVLGIVPGVRTLALEDARLGVPFALAGVALILAFLVVSIGWRGRHLVLGPLRISEAVELADVVCLLALLSAYEGLRLVEELERRTRRPWASRMIAAVFLPALLATVLLPSVVRHAPRLLEALWWASAALATTASPAAIHALVEEHVHGPPRRRLLVGWATAVATGALVFVGVAQASPTFEDWARSAAEQGFRLLPVVLGSARDV